jgi:molybdate transport system substrate-binding protein
MTLPLAMVLSVCLPAVTTAEAEPLPRPVVVTVFAASSTTEVLSEIAHRYQTRNPVKIRLNFGASSTLAQQLKQEAPCDIFVSADTAWMDYAALNQRIQTGSRRNIASNRLVVVTPCNKPLPIKLERSFDFARAFKGRLAMGDPAHVPGGIYAREALQALGWWDSVKHRIAPGENIRDALRFVERGEVDIGIVFHSDAIASKKVVIAATFPEDPRNLILYPAALCTGASPAARDFLKFLSSKDAVSAWKSAGFTPLPLMEE